MAPGDRVTIVGGADRLRDGELVGWASDGRARVWIPALNRTASYATDQIAVLQDSRFGPKRDRDRGRRR